MLITLYCPELSPFFDKLVELRGKGGEQLNAWLAAREKMELKETTAEE